MDAGIPEYWSLSLLTPSAIAVSSITLIKHYQD